MDRRNFSILSGASALALSAGMKRAAAQAAAPLGAGLTPFGSEAAGNAAGTIPPWTGGLTATPPGFTWDQDKTLPPDFFASDTLLYEVNSSNVSQYAHLLSDGVQALIAKGFTVPVYPTHRTAAYPDFVLQNIALNVNRAQLDPAGGRLGFSGGLGGIPFPIPDTSDRGARRQRAGAGGLRSEHVLLFLLRSEHDAGEVRWLVLSVAECQHRAADCGRQ
jgi:hypothetical protein